MAFSALAAALTVALGSSPVTAASAGTGIDAPPSRSEAIAAFARPIRRVEENRRWRQWPSGGTYWPITNCADSGLDSMGDAVASATSGDTIEAIGRSCPKVTLSSAIVIDVGDLTIEGAGPNALTVSNGAARRIRTRLHAQRWRHAAATRNDDRERRRFAAFERSRQPPSGKIVARSTPATRSVAA